MNIPTQNRMCAHKGCLCMITDGQSYCGPHCSEAALDTEPRNDTDRCECGHAVCTHLSDGRMAQP